MLQGGFFDRPDSLGLPSHIAPEQGAAGQQPERWSFSWCRCLVALRLCQSLIDVRKRSLCVHPSGDGCQFHGPIPELVLRFLGGFDYAARRPLGVVLGIDRREISVVQHGRSDA